MTLGLAVAIGSAVDDAIVDAEMSTVVCENKYSSNPRPVLDVVFEGCQGCAIRYLEPPSLRLLSSPFALTGVEGSILFQWDWLYGGSYRYDSYNCDSTLCAILLPSGRLPEESLGWRDF